MFECVRVKLWIYLFIYVPTLTCGSKLLVVIKTMRQYMEVVKMNVL